jgi:hypothetical protein
VVVVHMQDDGHVAAVTSACIVVVVVTVQQQQQHNREMVVVVVALVIATLVLMAADGVMLPTTCSDGCGCCGTEGCNIGVDDSPGDGVMLPRSSSRGGRWVDGADMLALQPCVAWPTQGGTHVPMVLRVRVPLCV